MATMEENRRAYIDALRFGDERFRLTDGQLMAGQMHCAIGLGYKLFGIAGMLLDDEVVSPWLEQFIGDVPDNVWSMNDQHDWEKVPCDNALCTRPGNCSSVHHIEGPPTYTWPQIADWLENFWKEQDSRGSEVNGSTEGTPSQELGNG